LGSGAGGFYGPKESCGSTADDYDLHLMHKISPRAITKALAYRKTGI
jgi:hypothetical protein